MPGLLPITPLSIPHLVLVIAEHKRNALLDFPSVRVNRHVVIFSYCIVGNSLLSAVVWTRHDNDKSLGETRQRWLEILRKKERENGSSYQWDQPKSAAVLVIWPLTATTTTIIMTTTMKSSFAPCCWWYRIWTSLCNTTSYSRFHGGYNGMTILSEALDSKAKPSMLSF